MMLRFSPYELEAAQDEMHPEVDRAIMERDECGHGYELITYDLNESCTRGSYLLILNNVPAIAEFEIETWGSEYDHDGVIDSIDIEIDSDSAREWMNYATGAHHIVLLAHFASALINGDYSGLDDTEIETVESLAGDFIDCGPASFGECEHTGRHGDVATFTYQIND